MFSKKNTLFQQTFKPKNIKKILFLYKLKRLITFLKSKHLVLIFFFDFLSLKNQITIKNYIAEYNLQTFQLKKNILNIFYKKNASLSLNKELFANIIKNNCLLFTFTQNSLLSEHVMLNVAQKIIKIKNLYFVGGFFKHIFFRPKEFQKIQFLLTNQQQVKKNFIQILLLKKYFFQKYLCLKKYV